MYEYHCEKCGKNFDVEQRMVDDALTIHDECGGPVVKVFSSAGIVLKGSGFYKTDARSQSGSSKSSTKTSTEKSSSDKKADAPAPAKKESAPAAAPEKKASQPSNNSQ